MPILQNPNPAIIDPATLSGIRARYKLSASGLSAGSITGQTIPDLSGNSRDLVVSGTASYNASRINGKGAVVFGGGSAQADGFFEDVPPDWTIACVHRIAGEVEPWWDGTASWWMRTNSDTPPGLLFAGVTVRATPASRGDGWQSYCGVMDSSGGSAYTGGRHAVDFAGWASSNTGGLEASDKPMIICRSGAYELAEWIYFDRVLTWAERIALSRYFASEYAVYSPFVDSGSGAKPFVIAVGNSTTQISEWPRQLAYNAPDLLGGVANLAISGGTSATLTQQLPEMVELATSLRTLGVPIVKVCHHGHNNGFGVFEDYSTDTFAECRALGEKLMVTTSTPINDNDSAEDARTAYNDWIRGDAGQAATHGDPAEVIDYLVDAFGAPYEDPPTDSVISGVGKYSRTTGTPIVGSRTTYPDNWLDAIHPNVAGGAKMAEYIEPFLADVAAELAGLVDPKAATVGSTTSTTASLTCPAATGGFGPYTYQWYRDGSAVSGATSADLSDTGLAASTAYTYKRRATDAGGFYRETADVVATTASAGAPLTISLASSSVAATTATVTATSGGGTGSKTYAWTKDSVAISGQTGAVLNLTGLTASTTYAIGCTVTDGASATASGSIDVTTTSGGVALSVTLAKTGGTSTTLTITATPSGGTGSKTYAWTRDGSAVSGQASAVLTLTGLAPATTYAIAVTATDAASATATASLSATTADASPTYYRVNNGISRVSAPKTVGDQGITVANPERFGTQFPMKVTVFRYSTADPLVPYVPIAIYRVVARSGNQLVFDAAIEGADDVQLQAGDVAANVLTAGDD